MPSEVGKSCQSVRKHCPTDSSSPTLGKEINIFESPHLSQQSLHVLYTNNIQYIIQIFQKQIHILYPCQCTDIYLPIYVYVIYRDHSIPTTCLSDVLHPMTQRPWPHWVEKAAPHRWLQGASPKKDMVTYAHPHMCWKTPWSVWYIFTQKTFCLLLSLCWMYIIGKIYLHWVSGIWSFKCTPSKNAPEIQQFSLPENRRLFCSEPSHHFSGANKWPKSLTFKSEVVLGFWIHESIGAWISQFWNFDTVKDPSQPNITKPQGEKAKNVCLKTSRWSSK